MDVFWRVVLVTMLVGVGGTGLGGALGAFARRRSKGGMGLLLGFSAGLMLAIVCFDLLVDAAAESAASSLAVVVVMVLAGYGAVAFLNEVLSHGSHRRATPALAEKQGLVVGGLVMAVAVSLHNLPEGMIIGTAMVHDGASGVMLALVIGLHNIPEGMSVAVPLAAGGAGRGRAVLVTALMGATMVVGAVAGYWLGSLSPLALMLSLSVASGAIIHVVFCDLLPEAFRHCQSQGVALATTMGLLLGFVLIHAV